MALAPTLQKYLSDQGVSYDAVPHKRTMSALDTVQTSHIPADCLAKGILLKDREGYWLAVLPASRHVQLTELRTDLGERVSLASEEEVAEVFRDCARGAV